MLFLQRAQLRAHLAVGRLELSLRARSRCRAFKTALPRGVLAGAVLAAAVLVQNARLSTCQVDAKRHNSLRDTLSRTRAGASRTENFGDKFANPHAPRVARCPAAFGVDPGRAGLERKRGEKFTLVLREVHADGFNRRAEFDGVQPAAVGPTGRIEFFQARLQPLVGHIQAAKQAFVAQEFVRCVGKRTTFLGGFHGPTHAAAAAAAATAITRAMRLRPALFALFRKIAPELGHGRVHSRVDLAPIVFDGVENLTHHVGHLAG